MIFDSESCRDESYLVSLAGTRTTSRVTRFLLSGKIEERKIYVKNKLPTIQISTYKKPRLLIFAGVHA